MLFVTCSPQRNNAETLFGLNLLVIDSLCRELLELSDLSTVGLLQSKYQQYVLITVVSNSKLHQYSPVLVISFASRLKDQSCTMNGRPLMNQTPAAARVSQTPVATMVNQAPVASLVNQTSEADGRSLMSQVPAANRKPLASQIPAPNGKSVMRQRPAANGRSQMNQIHIASGQPHTNRVLAPEV